jgi:hypothetical protein
MKFFFILLSSLIATKKLTGKYLPIKVRLGAGQSLIVQCSSTAEIHLEGNLHVNSWGCSNLPSSISCGEDSCLNILGDFELGPDVHIEVHKEASLTLGGEKIFIWKWDYLQ